MRGFKLYSALIEALIEHWRPEKHTFHFPSCETTITLENIAHQLVVRVNRAPVVSQNMYDLASLVYQVLGIWPPFDAIDDFRVRITWLESKFQVTDETTDEVVIFASRAYLLQLIGGVLLPDKSGNLEHTQYLRYLEDFVVCRNTSWDSTISAFLYRDLCNATIVQSVRKANVASYLILLHGIDSRL
ncbi:protein MAIN-LIKE 2-like [Hibiscus syriacus]|uniref:protein MAIN-LIKE 2-like n=1 Tax=Hibiscus syriacus TaxID=106335 RepID=UPI0019207D37|nr:protein MAIN-LIKE 2-like [Hibiscus syriacus]